MTVGFVRCRGAKLRWRIASQTSTISDQESEMEIGSCKEVSVAQSHS